MTTVWFYSLASVMVVSVISLIGLFTLSINKDRLHRGIFFMVALAVGALLGDVLVHILPELYAGANGKGITIPLSVFAGFLLFFALEKFLRWHHSHGLDEESEHSHKGDPRHIGYLNIASDAVHNLIDGVLIGTSYLVSIEIGIATTIAVTLHEIPQEIGDFGLLLHAGFSRGRALFFNFLSAMTAILGVILALILGSRAEQFVQITLPLTAGSLLYIAASDLVPELHKTSETTKSILQFVGVITGFALMVLLVFSE